MGAIWSSATQSDALPIPAREIRTIDEVKEFLQAGGNTIQINSSMAAETVDYDVLERVLAITRPDDEGVEHPAIKVIVRKNPAKKGGGMSAAMKALTEDPNISDADLGAKLREMAEQAQAAASGTDTE